MFKRLLKCTDSISGSVVPLAMFHLFLPIYQNTLSILVLGQSCFALQSKSFIHGKTSAIMTFISRCKICLDTQICNLHSHTMCFFVWMYIQLCHLQNMNKDTNRKCYCWETWNREKTGECKKLKVGEREIQNTKGGNT